MKKLITLFLAAGLILISHTWVLTYSSGAPGKYSGAPGEQTCTACHGGTATTGGTITFGTGDTSYTPSQKYTITVTGESGTKNGFCIVAFKSDDTPVGTVTITDATNTQTVSGSSNHVTHASAGSSVNTWTYDWTAPSSDQGDITFYMTANKANGNFGSDGDVIYKNSLTIKGGVTGMDFALNQEQGFTVYPNPVHDYLNISDRNNLKIYHASIFDVNGKNVLFVEHFNKYQKINMSDLDAGIYFLVANSEKGSFLKKIIKQ